MIGWLWGNMRNSSAEEHCSSFSIPRSAVILVPLTKTYSYSAVLEPSKPHAQNGPKTPNKRYIPRGSSAGGAHRPA